MSFDDFLDRIDPFPKHIDAPAVVGLMVRYRKSLRHKRLPTFGDELLDIRNRKLKPACRITVTADAYEADLMRANDNGFPLLVNRWAAYDWQPVYGLDVLYLPADSLWAIEIAHQIAEAQPRSMAMVWPGETREEMLWN